MTAGDGWWRRRVPIGSRVAPRLGGGRGLLVGGNRLAEASRGHRGEGAAPGIEAAEAARAVPDRVTPVEVPAHEHAELRTRAPARLFGQLQEQPVEDDGVVARDHALFRM